jgi:hypothetical protein
MMRTNTGMDMTLFLIEFIRKTAKRVGFEPRNVVANGRFDLSPVR